MSRVRRIVESLFVRVGGLATGVPLIAAAVIGNWPNPWWAASVTIGLLLIVLSVAGFILDQVSKDDEGRASLPSQRPAPPSPITIHSVTSHQQSGGITAHTVNVAPPTRSFKSHDLTDLKTFLAQFGGTPVTVTCGFGDGEAAHFAEEVKELLLAAGWQVTGVDHVLRTPPPPGGISILFTGPDVNAHPWVMGLAERLIALGLQTSGGYNSQKDEIHVGHL